MRVSIGKYAVIALCVTLTTVIVHSGTAQAQTPPQTPPQTQAQPQATTPAPTPAIEQEGVDIYGVSQPWATPPPPPPPGSSTQAPWGSPAGTLLYTNTITFPLMVVPLGARVREQRAFRSLWVADEQKVRRVLVTPFAALGGSLLGALIGAVPGAIVLGLSNCPRGCVGATVGTVIGNIGGFTGLILGAGIVTNAAGRAYGGQGTRLSAALGYLAGGAVSAMVLGAGALANSIELLVFGGFVMTVLPPIGATVGYEIAHERQLAPLRARAEEREREASNAGPHPAEQTQRAQWAPTVATTRTALNEQVLSVGVAGTF